MYVEELHSTAQFRCTHACVYVCGGPFQGPPADTETTEVGEPHLCCLYTPLILFLFQLVALRMNMSCFDSSLLSVKRGVKQAGSLHARGSWLMFPLACRLPACLSLCKFMLIANNQSKTCSSLALLVGIKKKLKGVGEGAVPPLDLWISETVDTRSADVGGAIKRQDNNKLPRAVAPIQTSQKCEDEI